ncbi:MAG: OmpA family protein [Panacagrimonas sp.]
MNDQPVWKKLVRFLGSVSAMALALPAMADDEAPFYRGGYVAPMATYLLSDAERLDGGLGGTLALGWRSGTWAVEIAGILADIESDESDNSPELSGGAVNGLVFPFSSLPNLYGIATLGAASLKDYPVTPNNPSETDTGKSFSLTRVGAGVGHLFPISVGLYEFAVRAEALYVAGRRDKDVREFGDIDAPRRFDDVVFNLGVHLPFGSRQPAPPPAPPVEVVPPVSICADTLDNDGDGLIDFPGDPGCSTADDNDEIDPPQCSDGKDNDGDGLIDFPSDKGCTAAEDTDETDPCKTPAPGERISLKGCGTGDVIVLRGVNFEFDKARLTANAKTILDNVAEELTAYPEIEIELSGHTDDKGSDEYNQKLSEKRAAAVKAYLVSEGVQDPRMKTLGHGESLPVADNQTDEGREFNRRVELKVTGRIELEMTVEKPGQATVTVVCEGSSPQELRENCPP